MRRRTLPLLILFSLVLCVAQAADEPITLLPALPEVLFNFDSAVDAHHQQVVVFGGATAGGKPQNTTYLYDLSKKTWRTLDAKPAPLARTHHALAYLPQSKQVVLFGGRDALGNYLNDTWVFTGRKWKRLTGGTAPSHRASAAMEPVGGGEALILFGGFSPVLGDLQDTWRFADGRWEEVAVSTSPSPRSVSRMTPYMKNGGVLLFGGFGPLHPGSKNLVDLDDTWTFDGKDWTRIEPVESPGPRSGHSMVQDRDTGLVILLGGAREGRPLHEVWTFTGTVWRLSSAPDWKAPLAEIELVEDPVARRIFALTLPGPASETGADSRPTAYLNDTWTFADLTWKKVDVELAPKRRSYSRMAFDAGRNLCVLFGGSTGDAIALDDTWEFDGKTWRSIALHTRPSPRFDHGLVFFDKLGKVLLFGGFGPGETGNTAFQDTWLYDGGRWTELLLATSPPGRSRHSLAYDQKRQLVWMFGGFSSAQGEFNDLWQYNGTDWSALKVDLAPPPRSSACLAYNPTDDSLVLFGGQNKAHGMLADTWRFELSSKTWSPVETEKIPAARQDAGFVFDQAARTLTMIGGYDGRRDLADVWVFDGANWERIDSRTPVARAYFAIAYDRAKEQTVLFGGYGLESLNAQKPDGDPADSPPPGTWEFDGNTWKQIPTATHPSAELSYGMAYDPKRRLVVLFGGYNLIKGELAETWVFDGKAWRWIPAPTHPGERTNPSLIYDPQRKKVLCYGGYHPEKGALGDLWAFDGKTWSKLPVACPVSNFTGGTGLVYDSNRKVFYYYGARQAP